MTGLNKILSALHGQEHRDKGRQELGMLNRTEFLAMSCEDEVESVGGAGMKLVQADPGLLLARLVRESVQLQAAYTAAWARSASRADNPWSAIIAWDEFTPGNKLSTDQARKTMVVSFSFLELGGASLSAGASWCTSLVIRSSRIAQVLIQ